MFLFLRAGGAAVRAVCETKARHNSRSWHESKDRNVGFLLTGIETMVDVFVGMAKIDWIGIGVGYYIGPIAAAASCFRACG
jgi:hypothetical protein